MCVPCGVRLTLDGHLFFLQISTRQYVCHLQKFLSRLLSSLPPPLPPIPVVSSEHTGTFTSPYHKIGSIGIQIRRRVTSHGFSLNVEQTVLPWFQKIVACGLQNMEMTSIQSELGRLGHPQTQVSVADIVRPAVQCFGEEFGRKMVELKEFGGPEVKEVEAMLAEAA